MSNGTAAVLASPYGYTPTRGVAILYVILFGFTTSAHTVQAFYYRMWWLLPTICLGALGETIGWSGRLWSSINVLNGNAFLMQITSTIIAPSFMTAANFIMLGMLIRRLGAQYCRLSPNIYTRVFITADVVSLVVQGAGGGIASVGSQNQNVATANLGSNIMLGGIIFQMVAITLYSALAIEFVVRVRSDKPVQRFRLGRDSQSSDQSERIHFQRDGFGFGRGSKLSLMIIGLGISSLFIYIRSIYRTAELAGGWTGPIITTEWFFDVFDALPITISLYTLNALHPGWLLSGKDLPAAYDPAIVNVANKERYTMSDLSQSSTVNAA